MRNNNVLQGWVVFSRGEAHALYKGDDGLVYLCGNVLYDNMILEAPKYKGLDIVFCADCRKIIDFHAASLSSI